MIAQDIVTDPKTGAQKGKSMDRYDLIPPKALEAVALVYGFGTRKYADRNWEKGYSWGLSFRALIKHAYAAWRGEWLDPESGLPHLAHAAWHCLTLMTYRDHGLGTDDRSLLREREEAKPQEGPAPFPMTDADQAAAERLTSRIEEKAQRDGYHVPAQPQDMTREPRVQPIPDPWKCPDCGASVPYGANDYGVRCWFRP